MAGAVQELDLNVDLLKAILWQYNDAQGLRTLLERKAEWYGVNQSAFWSDWIADVFDLRTANDFGLSVWGRILAVPLVAAADGSGSRPVFGFGEHNLNFYNSNFGRNADGVVNLTTEQKRLVLRLRYFQLTSNGTVPEINRFLAQLFGDQGRVYVLDSLDMEEAVYVFTFRPAASVLFVFEKFDLLPRPAGVGSRVLIQPGDSFGFAPYYLNFGNSNFGGA